MPISAFNKKSKSEVTYIVNKNRKFIIAGNITKKFAVVLLSFSMILNVPPCISFASGGNDAVVLYVSPDGDKNGDGSFDNPYDSLMTAKNAIRQIKSNRSDTPITVYLRGGKYNEGKVTFESADSGTETAPITYKAYNDEVPVFSGGVTLDTSDFHAVSKADYKRLPEGARDNVGVVDLREKGINHIEKYTGKGLQNYQSISEINEVPVSFYFDDDEQSLARWPNGADEWASVKSAPASSDRFTADTGGRIYNWVGSKDAVISAYFRVDWAHNTVPVDSIMPTKDTIKFTGAVNSGLPQNSILEGGRWAITNLLEELDTPGEYFVDADRLKLYFYPPYSTVGVDMQLAVGESSLLSVTNARYISFDGITFEKNRNTAAEIDNSSNIEFNSCKFSDISLRGIYMKDCESVTVDGCDFVNIGSVGIDVNPANVEASANYNYSSLKPQNVVVNNCDFYEISTKSTYSGAVRLSGVGNSVTRCRMHECKTGVIYFKGNDHRIIGNEIYNVLKLAKDQGAVYHGRQITQRGNEFAYNYFHDFRAQSDRAGYATAIYFDDLLGGNNVHHNIFANAEESVSFTGGSDNKFDNNIVVSCDSAGRFASGGYGSSSFKTAYSNFVNLQIPNVATIDDFKKYANMNNLYFLDEWPPFGLSIKSNLFYNNKTRPTLSDGARLFASEEDNLITYDTKYNDIFVSPDDGDYGVRADAELPQGYEGLKDISMDKIGLYKSETRQETSAPLGHFRQYLPVNHADGVDGGALLFQWKNSLGADYYTIEIALDKNFENIVYSADVPFNYAAVKDIENTGEAYYWRAYAVSDGYGCNVRLLSDDGFMAFRTTVDSNIDLSALESAIARCDEFVGTMTEGSEPGNFAVGAKAELEQISADAKELLTAKRVSQFTVDETALTVDKAVTDAARTITRVYTDVADIMDGNWTTASGKLAVDKTADGLHIANSDEVNMSVATCDDKAVTKDALLSFEIRCDTDEKRVNAWKGIALCDKDSAGKLIWSGGMKGYLLVIKPTQLELQRWLATGNKVVDIADNPFINGEMNKVSFGILSFTGGQRVILEVNGKTVFDYVNTESIVEDDLYFSLYDTMYNKLMENSGVTLKNRIAPESVISYVSLEPEHTDASHLEGVIKSASGEAQLTVANGQKISTERLDGIKTLDFSVKPDLSGGEQGIIFADNGDSRYKLSFISGRVSLEKEVGKGRITLFGAKSDSVKNGEWNDVSITRRNYSDTVDITIVINGRTVVDCTDEYPIEQRGGFGAYSLGEREISVRAR